MYLKGERFKSKGLADLSPASYNFQTTYITKANCVPFNCSAPAQALAALNKVPAPCTYNIKYRKQRIKGVASFKYTSPIGYYEKKRKKYEPKDGVQPIPQAKYTIPGVLHRGKLPRFVVPSDISGHKAPTGVLSMSDCDTVRCISIKDPLRPCEPLYCTFPFELNATTLKYKGHFWSKRKSARKFLLSGHPDSPGVGSYDLLEKPPNSFIVFCEKLRFLKRLKSRSLRTLDVLFLRLKRLKEPGPGYYDVVTTFDRVKSIHDTGTFSKAKRKFTEIKDSPQSYLDITKFFKHKSKQMCWPPFNSSSKQSKAVVSSERSPADYTIWKHTFAYSIAKELSFPRVVYPFNSSAVRVCLPGVNNDIPEPWAYNIDRFPFKPCKRVFGVKDAISYEPPLKLVPKWQGKQKEIAPCTYDVDSSLKMMYGRRDFHKGEVWKITKRDRLECLMKPSQDLMYEYGNIDLCSARCGPFAKPADPRLQDRKRRTFKPPKLAEYYSNRLEGLVRALLSADTPAGLEPVPSTCRPGGAWGLRAT